MSAWPWPAKSGAGALPKMVKASGAAWLLPSLASSLMPVWLLRDTGLRDRLTGEGTSPRSPEERQWKERRQSPGCPELNPFVASRSPGIALLGHQPAQHPGAGPPASARPSTCCPTAWPRLPFQATSSSCGSSGMLLPSRRAGLTYEARYGTDSQI